MSQKKSIRFPITVLFDEPTYQAIIRMAQDTGVSKEKLIIETMNVALGRNRTCAMS